jgi:hypothetical protein
MAAMSSATALTFQTMPRSDSSLMRPLYMPRSRDTEPSKAVALPSSMGTNPPLRNAITGEPDWPGRLLQSIRKIVDRCNRQRAQTHKIQSPIPPVRPQLQCRMEIQQHLRCHQDLPGRVFPDSRDRTDKRPPPLYYLTAVQQSRLVPSMRDARSTEVYRHYRAAQCVAPILRAAPRCYVERSAHSEYRRSWRVVAQ